MATGISDFFVKTARLPLLTAKQEKDLARRARNSDTQAIEKLVVHNVRLAISIAKKWQNRGLPLEDLVQEGMLGLDRAARKFDPDKDIRFSTYATWWVNHFIQRAVHNKGQIIKVPAHVTVRRLKIEEVLVDNPGATLLELAKAVECNSEEVLEALSSSRVVASLDEDNDDTHSLHERLSDPRATDPVEELFTDDRVRDALLTLSDEARTIVEMRYGIGRPVQKRDEVARELNITPAKVQSSLKKSTQKLAELLSDLRPPSDMGEAVELEAEAKELVCARSGG